MKRDICKDEIIESVGCKRYTGHLKIKCQRNILTVNMTESGVPAGQTINHKTDEQQETEPSAESQTKVFQEDALSTGNVLDKNNTEIVLKTIDQSYALECDGAEPESAESRDDEADLREEELIDDHSSLRQETESTPSTSTNSEQKSLVLWRYPILTLLYFSKELFMHIREMLVKVAEYRRVIQIMITVLIAINYMNSAHGACHPTFLWAQKKLLWCLYWFSLGMLSSVGLGTGVHTFALYLGPYIASVTVAANECGYLNFLEDSVQGNLECPQDPDPRWATSLWNVMCKVRLESYMWGLGTAVGELPPYFVGRAARLSRREERTEVLREFEELERKKEGSPESLTRLDRVKLFVRDLVVKAGFWGILACASIPNPFFDLAGITCGNFLIPFWTFFGATLVGKGIIKTTIQQVFVILSFNKTFLSMGVEILSKIPFVGHRLQRIFSQYIDKQKEKIFSKDKIDENHSSGWFSKAYHAFVIGTFLYFSVSIINSLAQNHQKRLQRENQSDN